MGRTRLEHAIEYLRGTENRYLVFAEGGHAQGFAPDTPEWFAWLATIPSFHFQGSLASSLLERPANSGEPPIGMRM